MMEPLPPLLGGRYRPIRLLGRGGTSTVYEVEHAHTRERLALKLLAHHALSRGLVLERFRREASVSARINSEHVVRVTDADVAHEVAGAPYIVMELLVGEDLARACGDDPQPADRVIDWLRQVAKALDKAHGLGVIHRDLKPGNLFLARREDGTTTVKVLDFGLAKLALEGGASTASGEIVGTPLFMAPEQGQLQGGVVTRRSDLFALGLTAHRLLTGRHYWNSRLLVQLVREVCLEPMPAPSERGSKLGPAFDAWFARACHREPAHRFENAGAQVEALAAALGEPVTPPPFDVSTAPLTTRSRLRRQKRMPRQILVALGIAASMFGASLALRPVSSRPASGVVSKPELRATSVLMHSQTGIDPATTSSSPATSATDASSAFPHASSHPSSGPAIPSVRARAAYARPAPMATASAPLLARDPWADQK
jgi:serine/threonine protein kinase